MEKSEQLINKQDVIAILKKNRFRFNLSQAGYSEGVVLWYKDLILSDAIKEIEKLQPVEVSTKKTGYWISVDDTGMYKCSECGGTSSKNSKKCPHCDTKME